eukprot:Clim_evm9s46 gene=Clim_evmTU9s46
MQHDIWSRIRFTYRCDFPRIGNTAHDTDAGWGCMLRCAQMLLAQSLIITRLSRSWRLSEEGISEAEVDEFHKYLAILREFDDSPTRRYSLHRIATTGEEFDRPVGTWFGPNTACQVIRKLCNAPADSDDEATGAHEALTESPGFRVVVAMDGIIFRDDLPFVNGNENDKDIDERDITKQSLDTDGDGPKRAGTEGPVLLLVPVRLGLDAINAEYCNSLSSFFHLPFCVGAIGGKPNSAYYFFGAHGQRHLLYFDPHVIQDRVDMSALSFSDDSFHDRKYDTVNIRDMDPSIALGFMLCDANDVEALLAYAAEDPTDATQRPVFSIVDRKDVFKGSRANVDIDLEEEDEEFELA